MRNIIVFMHIKELDDDDTLLNSFSVKQSIIIEEERLMELFKKCQHIDCEAAVDQDNLEVIRNGAYMKITATCNNNHVEMWESSSRVGEGHIQYPVINLLLVIVHVFLILKNVILTGDLHPLVWIEYFSGTSNMI